MREVLKQLARKACGSLREATDESTDSDNVSGLWPYSGKPVANQQAESPVFDILPGWTGERLQANRDLSEPPAATSPNSRGQPIHLSPANM